MAEGGGGRGWLFLRRNDLYAEARLPFAGGAPSFLDAPFPLRRQTEADLEAVRWGLFAWTAGRPTHPSKPSARRTTNTEPPSWSETTRA